MKENICCGDVVISLAGKDKGECFIVLQILPERVIIVDGKNRKISNPKTKNVKHVKKVCHSSLKGVADDINNGKKVSNERLCKLIKSVIKINREDKVCV